MTCVLYFWYCKMLHFTDILKIRYHYGHLSWRGAPGSGRCRGSGGSRGRKAEVPSEAQSAQQLNPTGPATSPRCPVTPPDPGSAQGERGIKCEGVRFKKMTKYS